MKSNAKELKTVKGVRLILGYIGLMMGLIGIIIALPLVYILFNSAEWKYALSFCIPSLIYIIIGFSLFFSLTYKKKPLRLYRHQNSFIVVISWLIAIIGCALPFVISNRMNFHQAFFEMSSGWATVGLTVYDFEKDTNCFLLARTNTMLFGGIGIILVMISLFSDRYGMSLYSAEGHSDRFLPNLLKSSRIILLIYCSLIIVGTFSYFACGMSFFDAFCHSVTAVSTGGFSTHPESLKWFQGQLSETQYNGIIIVSMFLMLSGSISSISWVFLFKGNFRSFFKSTENIIQFVIFLLFIPLLFIAFMRDGNGNLNENITNSFFYSFSALTTCGFQIGELSSNLHSAIFVILILLMLIGGQSNSTSGGMKIIRIHIFIKSIYIKIRNSLTPSNSTHSYRIHMSGAYTNLDDSLMHSNNIFILIYVFVFVIGTFIFSFSRTPLNVIMFEVSSMLSGTGLSTNALVVASSPNYYFYTASIIMIAGRLEIMAIIYAVLYCINSPYRFLRNTLERRHK